VTEVEVVVDPEDVQVGVETETDLEVTVVVCD
jgi:sortase (surface protein transpeptidase)